MPDTIGNWTRHDLGRFIQNLRQQQPVLGSLSFTADNLVAAHKLTCLDQIQFMQTQTTVGSAGSATALPATPSGYFRVYDNTGVLFVIPYYKAS